MCLFHYRDIRTDGIEAMLGETTSAFAWFKAVALITSSLPVPDQHTL